MEYVHAAASKLTGKVLPLPSAPWPLPNVWLGTLMEDQAAADARILHLASCPAAVRWLSAEPLIGPLDLSAHLGAGNIHWVVVGGESEKRSGPKPTLKRARRLKIRWAEDVLADCQNARVPFCMKQGSQANWSIWKDGFFHLFPPQLRVRQYPA